MTEPIHDYDPADSLVDSEAVAVFLADARDTCDVVFIAEAMAVVARAKCGPPLKVVNRSSP